jgi:hypothetical protein
MAGLQAPLSWYQVAAVALAAGFPPADAVIATSITEPESARIANNVQQGEPYATTGWGLWQITPGDSVPQYGINDALLDPLNNGKAAHYKWQQAGGFSPWTTYEHGLNQPYIRQAEIAVGQAAHLSVRQLDQLVSQIKVSGAAGGPQTAGVSDWSVLVRAGAAHVAGLTLTHAHARDALAKAKPVFKRPDVSPGLPGDILQQVARVRGDDDDS